MLKVPPWLLLKSCLLFEYALADCISSLLIRSLSSDAAVLGLSRKLRDEWSFLFTSIC